MNVMQLSTKNRVPMTWIPGHTNSKGNDMGDALEAEPFFGVSKHQLKKELNLYGGQTPGHTQAKKFVNYSPIVKKKRLDRRKLD